VKELLGGQVCDLVCRGAGRRMTTGLQGDISLLFRSSYSLIRKLHGELSCRPLPPAHTVGSFLHPDYPHSSLELRKELIRELELHKLLQVQFTIQRVIVNKHSKVIKVGRHRLQIQGWEGKWGSEEKWGHSSHHYQQPPLYPTTPTRTASFIAVFHGWQYPL
jgi:hypothetical protein